MKRWKFIFLIPASYLLLTLVINLMGEKKELSIPVKHATLKNWDSLSYWYPNWSSSMVHKGIDIFAPHKTAILGPVRAYATYLITKYDMSDEEAFGLAWSGTEVFDGGEPEDTFAGFGSIEYEKFDLLAAYLPYHNDDPEEMSGTPNCPK